MGGDHGPQVTVPAALEFMARLADVEIVLVGLAGELQSELAARGAAPGPRLRVRAASQTVAMDEPPAQALRYKRDSSMRVAVNLVKSGEAHACVSAGNTGALPLVGLLNIGVEDIKGNETVKQAAELLRASGLNFAGNVEGDDIYRGNIDVVVCDGFVGNVALKASEGVVQMMTSTLREEFKRNPFTRLAALVSLPVLRAFRGRMDHRRYNGASLLGLRGIVIKSHGSADVFAFGQALARAVEEVRNEVPQRIERRMTERRAVTQ